MRCFRGMSASGPVASDSTATEPDTSSAEGCFACCSDATSASTLRSCASVTVDTGSPLFSVTVRISIWRTRVRRRSTPSAPARSWAWMSSSCVPSFTDDGIAERFFSPREVRTLRALAERGPCAGVPHLLDAQGGVRQGSRRRADARARQLRRDAGARRAGGAAANGLVSARALPLEARRSERPRAATGGGSRRARDEMGARLPRHRHQPPSSSTEQGESMSIESTQAGGIRGMRRTASRDDPADRDRASCRATRMACL